jgi:hypothetical protein
MTPWGRSDFQTKLIDGIISYSTPSHGGIHVRHDLNLTIHPAWRNNEGWYEEDEAWAIVAYHFPAAFTNDQMASAIQSLKNSRPREYMQVTGTTLAIGESKELQEEAWRILHANHLQVVAAFGSWHPKVPAGMVGVFMVPGGRNKRGQYDERQERCFLVPENDYTSHFFIEDETKYQEIDKLVWESRG